MEKQILEELQQLTGKLTERQDAILRHWEHKIRALNRKSTELASLSRREFLNNVPHFLQRLYDGLLEKDINISDIGRGHGSNRWEYGFDLLLTVKEWGILQDVLSAEITSLRKKLDLSPDTLDKVHNVLNRHIQEAIEYSIREFDQLQRRETEAQMRDLEMVLQIPKDISRNNLRGTSHDLKGMVKNLQFGFFLLKDEQMSEKAREYIDQMAKAADSLEKLLNDLLDLFRLETGREKVSIEEFDAAKMLRELCESMQPIAKKETLDLTCSGTDSLSVKSDQTKLQRIVRNLLLNALKYTEEGFINVRWEKRPDSQWLLEISDTGPGLGATHAKSLTTEADASETDGHKKVFEESHEEVEKHGEGIGLLIVRHLCRLLDAIIQVETEPGEGTTFKLIFPEDLDVDVVYK